MDRISATSVCLALWVSIANAQTPPERVLGTSDGNYQLFTPRQVVDAGGGSSSGGNVPTPPTSGTRTFQSIESALTWSTPTNAVLSGLPSRLGKTGQCLQATNSGTAWAPCGSARTLSDTNPENVGTPAPGSESTVSRSDHVHGGSGGSGASFPSFVGNASKVLGVNSNETGVEWDDPASVVRAGLPTTTGKSGDCLVVNSQGSDYELGSCGGGGPSEGSNAYLVASGTWDRTAMQTTFGQVIWTQNTDDPGLNLMHCIQFQWSDGHNSNEGSWGVCQNFIPSKLIEWTGTGGRLQAAMRVDVLTPDDSGSPSPNARMSLFKNTDSQNGVTNIRLRRITSAFGYDGKYEIYRLGVASGFPLPPGQLLPTVSNAITNDGKFVTVNRGDWVVTTPLDALIPGLRLIGNATRNTGESVLTRQGNSPAYTFAWTTGGGTGTVPPYRNTTPPNVNYVTSGHPGTENSISRGDHVHSLPSSGVIATATPKAPGTAAAGSATTASASDHVHPQEFPSVAPTADLEVLTTVNGVLLWDDLFGKLKAPPRAADQGKVVRVTDDLDTAKTEFVYDDPHATVLDGLPAITGQGGKVLTVNSAATGVAWESGGGGSGTGGGEGWKARYTWDAADGGCTANCTNWGVTFSDADATAFNAIAGDDELELRVILETQFRANDSRVYVAYLATNPSNRANRKLYGTAPYADAPAAFNVEITLGTSSNIAIRANDASGATITMDIRRLGAISLESRSTKTGGGGGGSSGPTIPEPTTAGKLKHLRVNAAGAAYELADPPVPRTPGALIKSIKSGSNVAGTETTYARTDHEHAIPSTLYGTPVDVGTSNSAGTATTLSRSDHVHKTVTQHVIPEVPADHADHEYLLIPNSAGTHLIWDHGIDDALQENAADIGAADRRIDDLVMPSFGVPYPEDGFAYSTSGCLFNVDLQKEVCSAKWMRPATWQRVILYDHEFSDWAINNTQTITIQNSDHDIHAAMESPVTAYRNFEVHLTWAKRTAGQRSVRQTTIHIGGMAPQGVLSADDNAIFYSQNSLNTVSGNIGWARLELTHDGTTSKLVVNFNVQGERFVRAVLIGIR